MMPSEHAPRHTATGGSEQNADGTWLSKFVCPDCGWEKHFTSGKKGTMTTINRGDPSAHHSGTNAPGIFTNISLEPFENFLKELDDD